MIGPLPDGAGIEWVGKSVKDLQAEMEKQPKAEAEVLAAKPLTAAQLLADKTGMKHFTFVAEAKRILGKDFPTKNDKAEIVKALEKRAIA